MTMMIMIMIKTILMKFISGTYLLCLWVVSIFDIILFLMFLYCCSVVKATLVMEYYVDQIKTWMDIRIIP